MHVPKNRASSRLERKNSIFLADVFPVTDEGQVKEIVRSRREEHQKCSHVAWAFSLGEEPTQYRFSDDGEPGGTAGRPVLDVIRYKELTDILITVVRYFGGTKLGTGGLVKAYTDSANAALQKTKIKKIIPVVTKTLTVEYSGYEPVKRIVEREGGRVDKEDFHTAVTMECTIPEEKADAVLKQCIDATGGNVISSKRQAGVNPL